MTMGCPSKGYKLTASRVEILRALAIQGPFVDGRGRAASQLLPYTSQRTTQSLSCALEGLEAVGLIGRVTHSQRTYRIEAVLDRLTPADLATLDLPSVPRALGERVSETATGVYLTQNRVEVLRALLAQGPIYDPAGHATRILMGRLGRPDLPTIHALLKGMARVGLVRRTVERGRVVGLAAAVEGLPAGDQDRIWSRADFAVVKHAAALTCSEQEPLKTSDVELPARADAVLDLRAELATAKAEAGRLRLELEMFRAWAKRMPTLGPRLPLSARPGLREDAGHLDAGGDLAKDPLGDLERP